MSRVHDIERHVGEAFGLPMQLLYQSIVLGTGLGVGPPSSRVFHVRCSCCNRMNAVYSQKTRVQLVA